MKRIEEFVRRGVKAQKAVDKILKRHQSKQGSPRKRRGVRRGIEGSRRMLPEHMVDRMILAIWFYDCARRTRRPDLIWHKLTNECVVRGFPLGASLRTPELNVTTADVEEPLLLNDRPWLSCKLPI